jgi:hypothetical protein
LRLPGGAADYSIVKPSRLNREISHTLALTATALLVLLSAGTAVAATSLSTSRARQAALKEEKAGGLRAEGVVHVHVSLRRSGISGCDRITPLIVECTGWSEFDDTSGFDLDLGGGADPPAVRCTTIHRVSLKRSGRVVVANPYETDCVAPTAEH